MYPHRTILVDNSHPTYRIKPILPESRARSSAFDVSAIFALVRPPNGERIGIGDLAAASTAAGGMDLGTILAQVAAGGVGGGVLMAIGGVFKGMMAR